MKVYLAWEQRGTYDEACLQGVYSSKELAEESLLWKTSPQTTSEKLFRVSCSRWVEEEEVRTAL